MSEEPLPTEPDPRLVYVVERGGEVPWFLIAAIVAVGVAGLVYAVYLAVTHYA